MKEEVLIILNAQKMFYYNVFLHEDYKTVVTFSYLS